VLLGSSVVARGGAHDDSVGLSMSTVHASFGPARSMDPCCCLVEIKMHGDRHAVVSLGFGDKL
jgi:hypothetical protein